MDCRMCLTKDDIIGNLRVLIDKTQPGTITQKELAKMIGISEQFLCDILKGKRNPGVKVCQFLKVEPVLVYREKKE